MMASLKEIYIGPERMAGMKSVHQVEAITERGLKGDRYEIGTGSYSRSKGYRDVTLMEVEALWNFYRKTGIDLHPSLTRRNLLTQGVVLSNLIGARFSIGPVTFLGLRLCPPCFHLAKMIGIPDILKELAYSGGVYARILNGGSLGVGDEIVSEMFCKIDDQATLIIE